VGFCDVKVCGLWDSTSVDQGIGYDSVKRYLIFRTNILLFDIFAEDFLDRAKSAAAHRNAIFFCNAYHEVSERVMRVPEMIARDPGAAAIFAP
jgi:hypothetical protein